MTHARPAPPISDYALLGDSNGSALVARDGSIDWACLPRFDSPSTFARLLDPDAGYWLLAPEAATPVGRRYLDGTMVLESRFRCPHGTAVTTDALALGEDEEGHDLGHRAPHVVLRRITCESGAIDVRFELALRPEYGLAVAGIELEAGGARAFGGSIDYAVSCAMPLEIADGLLRGRAPLTAGQSIVCALQTCSFGDTPSLLSEDEIEALLTSTERVWRSWSDQHRAYEGPYQAEVRHSSLVLQALTYAPTGAMVAAPTTSLPEAVGGELNWDYRFCWVRDASVTIQALSVAACRHEAAAFFDFLAAAAGVEDGCSSTTPIMYGIRGERFVPEAEAGHLAGYAGSRPVRIGNAAWCQRQHDVHGAILDAAARLAEAGEPFPNRTRDFLVRLADGAASRWEQPDHGIWEQRGEPAHYLHSKLMCWVALDRAIELAPQLDAAERVADWTRERERIRTAIVERGWSAAAGAYTQSFGSDTLDAAALQLELTGFLPAHDVRMRATVDAIREHLTDDDGLVYRYRAADDGEPAEGTFALCGFWLVRCLVHHGDHAAASALFERLLSRANDVGQFAEEMAADGATLLGNFPQAYPHVGLIMAASVLERSRDGQPAGPRSR